MALAPTDMAVLPSEAIFNGNRANWVWQNDGSVAQLAEGIFAAGVRLLTCIWIQHSREGCVVVEHLEGFASLLTYPPKWRCSLLQEWFVMCK
jgi:hypothetical protein